MAYYNAKLALWEHVIETRGLGIKPDGTIIRKRWDMNVTLQQNTKSDLGSAFASPSLDMTDGCIVSNMPPLMVLSVSSTESLEITVTKTLVNCITTLHENLSDIYTSLTPRVSDL